MNELNLTNSAKSNLAHRQQLYLLELNQLTLLQNQQNQNQFSDFGNILIDHQSQSQNLRLQLQSHAMQQHQQQNLQQQQQMWRKQTQDCGILNNQNLQNDEDLLNVPNDLQAKFQQIQQDQFQGIQQQNDAQIIQAAALISQQENNEQNEENMRARQQMIEFVQSLDMNANEVDFDDPEVLKTLLQLTERENQLSLQQQQQFMEDQCNLQLEEYIKSNPGITLDKINQLFQPDHGLFDLDQQLQQQNNLISYEQPLWTDKTIQEYVISLHHQLSKNDISNDEYNQLIAQIQNIPNISQYATENIHQAQQNGNFTQAAAEMIFTRDQHKQTNDYKFTYNPEEINYEQNLNEQLNNNKEDNFDVLSMKTDQINEKELRQDQDFEQKLWDFYKNMMEKLDSQQIEHITKNAQAFCDQIDMLDKEYKQQKKLEKNNQALQDTNFNNKSDQAIEADPSYSDSIPEQNTDKSFQNILFGNESQLNPDGFLQTVLDTLKDHKDIQTQFKRFLPQDDEEDEENLKDYLFQSREANQILCESSDAKYENESYQNYPSELSEELKKNDSQKIELFKKLIEDLKNYGDAKNKNNQSEVLKEYSDNVLKIVEKFQQCVSKGIEMRSNITTENQNSNKEHKNIVDQIESQMKSIFTLIPQEIIENFNCQLLSPQLDETNQQDILKVGVTQSKSKVKSTVANDGTQKKLGRPRRIKEETFVSSSKIDSTSHRLQEKNLLKIESSSKNNKSNVDNNLDVESDNYSEKDSNEDQEEEGEQENETEVLEFDEELKEIQDKTVQKEEYEGSLGENSGDQNDSISEINENQQDGRNQADIVSSNQSGVTKQLHQNQGHSTRVSSVTNDLQVNFPSAYKNLNKAEIKVFDSLLKQIKNQDDWIQFIKLFLLYIEGVICLKNFFALFDEKFGHKIKQDLKKEIELLFPTRDHSRRSQSNILKPWNDLPNQKVEKIFGSSYYKIDSQFQLPICSAKMDEKNGTFYQKHLNDDFLSLAFGSENFKFKVRNANEDLMFKNEDEMYKLDTQIDNFEKCHSIVEKELQIFDQNQQDKSAYEFPKHKFRPLMFFWEKKHQDALAQLLMQKPFQRENLVGLKCSLKGKLQELQNRRIEQLPYFEDVFCKNLKKSLDHRQFQYKDFIKKFQQKQYHIQQIKQFAISSQHNICREASQTREKCPDFPFHHSFGNFLSDEADFKDSLLIDNLRIDFNCKSEYQLTNNFKEKLPHVRLTFNNQEAKNITIKLLCFFIKNSPIYHNSDRPRLIMNLKLVLETFMEMNEVNIINDTVNEQKIQQLTVNQIDTITNQNSQMYYIQRCNHIKYQQQQQEHNDQSPQDINKEQIALKIDFNIEEIIQIQIQQSETELKAQGGFMLNPSNQEISEQYICKNEQKITDESIKVENSSSMYNNLVQKNLDIQEYKKLNVRNIQQNQNDDTDQTLIEQALFLPQLNQKLSGNDVGNKLLYAPSNIFLFLKFFHAIYERVLKGKNLVKEKIDQDLAEMSQKLKNSLNIRDKYSANEKKISMNEIFLEERYEYLLKGICATSTQCVYLQSANGEHQQALGYSQNHILMDSNKYEDFARCLLGRNAFLLFHVDKIMSQCVKQLQQMHSDLACQKAFKLFDIQKLSPDYNEKIYLSNYAEQVVDQFCLKDFQKKHQKFQNYYKNQQNLCNHSVNKFNSELKKIDFHNGYNNKIQQSQKFENSNNQNEAGDQQNQNTATATQQLQNFQAFRFLWSKESQILCIHYLNLNPYQIQNFKQNSVSMNYRKLMGESYDHMMETLLEPVPTFEPNCEGCKTNNSYNRLTSFVSPPIYLKRNLKLMRKYREKEAKIYNYSNLTKSIIPGIGQIAFESQTSDEMIIYRKTKLSQKQILLQDMSRQLEATQLRYKRFSSIQSTS